MAVKELKARFTADAAILKRVFREIQTEAGRLGPAVQRSTQVANRSFNDLGSNASRLSQTLERAGDVPAFQGLTQSAEQAQREIETTGRVSAATMTRLENDVAGAGDHFDSLGDDARQGFSDIEAAIQSVRGDLDRLNSADLNGIRQEADQASRNLDEVGDAARRAEQELDDLGDAGGLREATEASDGLAGSLGGLVSGGAGGVLGAVGAGFLAVTGFVGGFVAAGAGIYGFIKSSDELKRSTNALQTQTGATTEEMEGMRDSLVDIYGNNFGDGFQDIADSMANVKQQTNLSGDELESFTQNALMMRDTFEYDVAESTKAASILMKQFGIDGEEAMALIADGTQQGLNYADDLMDTIGEYSVYYEQAGFSAQEMFGMFKNAQETGAFNLDYAADAFKEFGIIMTEDSDRAAEALSSLGLPAEKLIDDFAKGGESARGAFETIAEKLGTVKEPLDQTQVGIELFGTKFEDLGADAVIAMSQTNDSITGTQEKLDEINAVKYDTVGEAIAGVGRKLVSNILIPIQDRIMPGVNDSINNFTGMIGTASEAIGAFIKGDESAQDVLMSYGLDPEQFQPLINAIDSAKDGFQRFRTGAGENLTKIKDALKGALVDAWPVILSTITTAIEFVQNNLRALTSFWQTNGEKIMSSLRKIADTVKDVFVAVWPSVRATVSAVATFLMDIIGKIQEFWSENGTQILEALTNAFNGIMAVIKFVMPAVLAIIRSIWGNIKGVITGALDIIMGVVKIFSGLFTGDFKKMWEGVKQLFKGAITFVWNFIQLTFYGKILGGAKTFVVAFRSFFVNLWKGIVSLFKGNVATAITIFKNAWSAISTATRNTFNSIVTFFKNTWASIKSITSGLLSAVRTIFSNGFQAVRNKVTEIFLAVFNFLRTTMGNIRTNITTAIQNTVAAARNAWSAFKTNTLNAFRDVYNGIKNRFTDIVDAAKALPGRIGEGIRLMASKVTSGVTSLINSMARTLGKGINGVISGINTVLDKIGVNTQIDEWEVPQWAKGTPRGGHPGGLAIVNDGTGDNAGPELIKTPDGKMGTLPGKNVVTHLPKGTQVLSAKKTKEFLQNASIPAYEWGTDLFDGAKNVYQKTKEKVGESYNKLKNWTVDVFEYIKNPSGLLNLALDKLGFENPTGDGFVASMAKGAVKQVKTGAINLIKKSLSLFEQESGGAGGVFGGKFRKSSSYGYRIHPVTGKRTFHNGDDWAAPAGTPIPAQAAGRVVQAGYHTIRGNYVRIKSGDYERIYQHNTKNMVRVGDMVKVGQTIGTVGSTGRSTGPHLHFELLKNGVNIKPTSLVGNVGAADSRGAKGGQGVSPVSKYIQAIIGDGDWLNDWATHVPKSQMSSLLNAGKKTAAYIKQYGRPAKNYFDAIADDGDWLNDWATHIPKSAMKGLTNVGKSLAKIQGYEGGGIVDGRMGAQLAWLTEGGFAESVISHDPSKKASQFDIWNKTGDMLGFNKNDLDERVLAILERIARGVESDTDRQILMNDRIVGQLVEKHVTERQKLNNFRTNTFNGKGGRR